MGPLSVAMGYGSDYGGHWVGDVYVCDDDYGANHAVVLVGYNDDEYGGYWIAKNSWGSTWGPHHNGYFKVGYGECSIENYVEYADPLPPLGQYRLAMEVSPPGSGTTVPSVGDHWYDSGTTVPVSASAYSGWQFVQWSGDCSGTDPSTSVYMNSPKTCAANFCHEGCLCYASSDTPVAIPDVDTISSIINVPDGLTIDDVNLTLDITHTWDEDLDVYLESPEGTLVELFTDVGGSDNNFNNTTLDDDCATAITDGTAPFTGCYHPEGMLSGFNGENSAGEWTLWVTDDELLLDGTLESWELELCGEPDQDGDGIPDALDNCPDDYNPGQEDNVHPGNGGDACEDPDDDGVPDDTDNCPDDYNPGQEDNVHPGDGGDACEDPDGDGVSDDTDNCPDDYNLGQEDNESDGIGDVCDDDDDNDDVLDTSDNCPLTPNSSQTDTDGDGLGDACDDDDDNDLMPDTYEEAHACLDPLLADGRENADGDELRNYPEMVVGTDPCVANPELALDSDEDGCSDGRERYIGIDPLDDCPDDPSNDAWLFDINIDTWSNILDVLLYKGHIQFQYPDPDYQSRLDLNADGSVDILDILLYKGHLHIQCTNP